VFFPQVFNKRIWKEKTLRTLRLLCALAVNSSLYLQGNSLYELPGDRRELPGDRLCHRVFYNIISHKKQTLKKGKPMTNKGISAFTAALFALVIISCDGTYNPNGGYKRVDYDLRGTWECMEEAFWYGDYTWKKGSLVLDYDSITITGPVAHLQGFTRGIALEAYTEDAEDSETGLLYIKDRGILQSPVSYRRWQSGGKPKDEMLTLTSGGVTDETFKQIEK
jgi:hypothetical protein